MRYQMQVNRWVDRWMKRMALTRAVVRDTLTNLQLGNRVDRVTDFGNAGRPVLLLYGFGSTRRALRIIELRLRRRLHRPVFSINLGGYRDTLNTAGIDGLAKLVDSKIENICAKYGISKIDIVAHSKGGLIARYYVQHLNGSKRVCNLITLGTPHRGTWAAAVFLPLIGWLARSPWSMTPISPMIRRFREDAWPKEVKLVSISSHKDWVSPPHVASLSPEQGTNVVLDQVTHTAMLFSKEVFGHIVEALQPVAPVTVDEDKAGAAPASTNEELAEAAINSGEAA
jgi:triacylglycerol lipase